LSDWVWVKNLGKYRNTATGQWMSRETMMGLAAQSLAASASATDTVAAMVAGGQLSTGAFGQLAWQEIKNEYIRQYLLSVGGRESMTPSDWGTIGRMLRDQRSYFRGFLADVQSGTLSEEQIRQRLRMYLDSAHQAYERAAQKAAKAAGYTEERWVLDEEAEHCADCPEKAAKGWVPVGTHPLPGSGATACLTNCHCYLMYRNPQTGETY